jgi:tRNA (cytidine56-2'-O)-methyltransferase
MIIFRLGHRIERDKRTSTHVALVGRLFGMKKFIYSGDKDESLEKSIKKVYDEWGGSAEIEYCKNSLKTLKNLKKDNVIIHLTMYGIRFEEYIEEVKKIKNMVIVVGASKVPNEVYKIADYNLAITNQPHSEISALGIFLYSIKPPENYTGKLMIIPQKNGKKVMRI